MERIRCDISVRRAGRPGVAGVGSLCERLDLRASDQVRKLTAGEAYQGFVVELDIRLVEDDRRPLMRKMSCIDV